jgi:hypothetical protein
MNDWIVKRLTCPASRQGRRPWSSVRRSSLGHEPGRTRIRRARASPGRRGRSAFETGSSPMHRVGCDSVGLFCGCIHLRAPPLAVRLRRGEARLRCAESCLSVWFRTSGWCLPAACDGSDARRWPGRLPAFRARYWFVTCRPASISVSTHAARCSADIERPSTRRSPSLLPSPSRSSSSPSAKKGCVGIVTRTTTPSSRQSGSG